MQAVVAEERIQATRRVQVALAVAATEVIQPLDQQVLLTEAVVAVVAQPAPVIMAAPVDQA